MINGLADGMLAAAHRLYPTIAGNDDYTAIISDRYYDRLQALIDDARAKGADIRTASTMTMSIPENAAANFPSRSSLAHMTTWP